MTGFAHIAFFIYVVYSVHNSVIIMVINIITVICILKSCKWLLRNCAQKLASWAGEWKKVADACKIKTIFCWQICSPWIWFLGMWRIFTFGPKSFLLLNWQAIDVIAGSAGNIYALFVKKFGPVCLEKWISDLLYFWMCRLGPLDTEGFEITSQIISQSSTVITFKEKNKLLCVT